LPSRRAGRAVNPRASAFSGSPGGRAAAGEMDFSGFMNPFISAHVPALWTALIGEYGLTLDYWPGGDETQSRTITVIWKEGREDEDVSPGRYSRALIQNVDLAGVPRKSDIVFKDGVEYDVSRVDAMPYNYSSILLQDRSEAY
jgi:hypothetical protein